MLVATKRKRKSPTFVIATFPRDHVMNNRMTEAMMGKTPMRVNKAIVSQKTCVLLRPIFKTRFRSPDMPAINPERKE